MQNRNGRSLLVLAFGFASVLASACHHSSKSGTDAAAGHDGGGDAAGIDGGDDTATGGTTGSDAADAPDSAVTADASDGATADGSDASDASDAPVGDTLPELDAGAGCVSPGPEVALSPAAEGLPTDGLVLWVRADRGVYKTATNEVCGWQDQTGHSGLLLAGGTRPAWQATGVGGQPGILFSIEGQDMGTSGTVGIGATSARTFIAVAQLVNPSGRFHPIIQGQVSSPGTYIGIDSNTWQTAGMLEGVYVTNNSFDTTLATASTPRVHVMTLSTMVVGQPVVPALDYRVNGATQTFTLKAGSGNFEDFSAANFTTVGAVSGTPSAGAAGGTGVVAEAIIYNRALTLEERMSVEAALKARYGILDRDH
ncbi:MAG TPA: hypothetical protein VHJ20_11340 [Polyangia bacterium]|nr:hypothetical protein [Polyangia bacterium]